VDATVRFSRGWDWPRIWTLGLTIVGTDTIITLGFFSRKAVKQACRARGWRFDDQVSRQRGIRTTRQ